MKFSMNPPGKVVPAVVNSQRFAVALVCWFCAGVGVMSSLMMAASLTMGTVGINETQEKNLFMRLMGYGILVAWIALGAMTKGWVQERKVHWLWPVFGSIAGFPAAVFFAPFYPLYITAVPLAIYLVYFHLVRARNGAKHGI
jgi:hypothetical protein